MERMLTIQTCGSLAVIGIFAASEAGALLLSAFPSSPLAWYLNLELFRPFECARVEASPLRFLFGPTAFANALAVLALALLARLRRHRLAVAVFANVSFAFTVFLSGAWTPDVSTLDGTGSIVLGFMLAASFVASATSHVAFVGAILAQRRGMSGGEPRLAAKASPPFSRRPPMRGVRRGVEAAPFHSPAPGWRVAGRHA